MNMIISIIENTQFHKKRYYEIWTPLPLYILKVSESIKETGCSRFYLFSPGSEFFKILNLGRIIYFTYFSVFILLYSDFPVKPNLI